MIEILIPMGAFAMIFGIVYIAVTSVHRQNMALIERGINPKVVNKKTNLGTALGNTLFALGIIIAFLLDKQYELIEIEAKKFISYFIVGVFFYGVGQLIAYFMEKNKDQDTTTDNYRIEE